MVVLSQTSANRIASCAFVLPMTPSRNDDTSDSERRSEVLGAVDVAQRARIAHWNFYQLLLVGGDHALRAFVAAQRKEFLKKPARQPDRMAAPRTEVRRGERCTSNERLAHRGERGAPQERHVGERDEVAVGIGE